jgi:hypothetical protein
MKKTKNLLVAALLGGSLMMQSCIGSFSLWNSLKDWNMGVDSKFVNEMVFFAFHIVPVYEAAYVADILVLNSIEFWSGDNPVADFGTKQVKGENGDYAITAKADGYTIVKDGDEEHALDLVYNAENRTWNAVAEGESYELFTMNEDGTATLKLQDGSEMTVMPNAEGMAKACAALGVSLPYCMK